MTEKNEKFAKSDEMGFPPEGTEVPVQGVLPGDMDDYEFSRLEKDPSQPAKGEDPSYITRAGDK